MKKLFLLFVLTLCASFGANALTYEEVFNTIKGMPNMKGVEGTMVSGDNDFSSIGVTHAQLILWTGETGFDKETEVYGNELYKVIGQLPVSEMVQSRISDSSIMAIFAKPISKDSNRILILSDSAGAGFTGALIGYINDECLNNLCNAILISREGGGTAIYLNVLNF